MLAALLLAGVFELVDVPCGKGAHQPQLSVANDGRVALAWGNGESIHCCVGTPGKNEEFQRDQLVAKGLKFAVGMRRGPRVALLADQHVVVTAIGGPSGGGRDEDLIAWRTLPDAKGWSEGVRVNSVKGAAREGLHAMARGPKGELFCAWIDLRSDKPQVWGALSKDAGKTWENEAVVSGTAEICPCCAPSVAFDAQNGVCVMWRGVREGARDMHLAVSSDGGKTFGAAQRLGSGAWKIEFCPMDGGALALNPEGKLVSAWRRDTSVYLASDGKDERLIGGGEQPWIAAGSVAWLEKRSGKLLFLRSGTKDPETLAESANDPVIAAAPDGKGPLYVAWETGAGASSEIKLARLAPR